MSDKERATTPDLVGLRLPELRTLAQQLGIRGISSMRKGELVDAIAAHNAGTDPHGIAGKTKRTRGNTEQANTEVEPSSEEAINELLTKAKKVVRDANTPHKTRDVSTEEKGTAVESPESVAPVSGEESGKEEASKHEHKEPPVIYESRSAARRARRNKMRQTYRERAEAQREGQEHRSSGRDTSDSEARGNTGGGVREERSAARTEKSERSERGERTNSDRYDRRRRNRNDRPERPTRRRRERGENSAEEIREGDVLQQIAGIVDIVDNNVAFVRTSGYHSASSDVFISQNMLRRYGLRRGDAIVGHIKQPREVHTDMGRGNRRQKYNPLVRVDSINGMSPEDAAHRPDFSKLTPLYPNQRLRLETEPKILTTRVIDLIMPIGKGQRALIVSPPKAGKTTILQNIANAIARNNPECHLMVVLVDERPEEVTDMQRSVAGEVIASTFDRPPSDHTVVAELAIARAKRLVELGQDVVVLLDSITRLGRAYNNSSPASGRILSGGVDSNALYPPKRFLGAARNIENGGSLTIIATAMVETGSAGDTVIFEEFKGTGNAELKLDRKIAERRIFPAVDVNPSGTRKDELLLAPEEARVMHKLRRILSALDSQQAIEMLITQLKKTTSNGEFMVKIASSAPMAEGLSEGEYI